MELILQIIVYGFGTILTGLGLCMIIALCLMPFVYILEVLNLSRIGQNWKGFLLRIGK